MATIASPFVAISENDSGSLFVYPSWMLSDWLQNALKSSGVNQSELARRLTKGLGRSIDRAAVNKMASGQRAIQGDELLEIERITGNEAPHRIEVPLVGYVGAGSAAHFYANGQGEIDRVPAVRNSTKQTVAVEIRGESLGPIFERGYVYYDNVQSPVTSDMYGRLCVVWLPDERVLVKQIKQSRVAGLYHLISNANEPPMLDVPVVAAALVKAIVPR